MTWSLASETVRLVYETSVFGTVRDGPPRLSEVHACLDQPKVKRGIARVVKR